MINKESLINKLKITISSSVDSVLSKQHNSLLNTEMRTKILNEINKSFEKELGNKNFEKFCLYLKDRNISMFIDNKDYCLIVCFYNGFMFFKLEEIINDYYKYLEESR